ncbi:hypothetical protein M405DRAFT_132836 [Rhizopogon salebrosus TDB-379]|nr:hypothetical protein M405DRAFT_132836 [Rhizopogon salebrosus TDB-379]
MSCSEPRKLRFRRLLTRIPGVILMFAPLVDAALMKCAGTGIFEFQCRTSYPFSTPFPPTSNPTCGAQILIGFDTDALHRCQRHNP